MIATFIAHFSYPTWSNALYNFITTAIYNNNNNFNNDYNNNNFNNDYNNNNNENNNSNNNNSINKTKFNCAFKNLTLLIQRYLIKKLWTQWA